MTKTLGAAFLLVILLLCTGARGQSSVTLGWDPATNGPVAGYRLYRGTASHVYTTNFDAGNVTQRTVSGLSNGVTYYVAATAYGTNGLESVFSSEVSFTATAATNPPPAIALTSPTDGAGYTAPATINLAAGVTTNGHTINKVQFYNVSSLLGEATTAPYTLAWTNVSAGTYGLSARLVYDGTSTTDSAPASVTVTDARGVLPPLVFSANSGTITAPFIVTNGMVYQTSSTTLAGGGRAAYSFTLVTPGPYTVSAVVKALTSSSRSLYLNMDADPVGATMIWDVPVFNGFTNRMASWRGTGTQANPQFVPKLFTLSAGTHQLILRGKDANVQFSTLTVSPAYPQLDLHVMTGGVILLSGVGPIGNTYDVLVAQDFVSWNAIRTITMDNRGSFSMVDSTAVGVPTRYYRLRGTAP